MTQEKAMIIAVSMRLKFSRGYSSVGQKGPVHTGVGFWPFYNILLTLGVHCGHYTTLIMSIPSAFQALQEQKEKANEQLHDSLKVLSGSLGMEKYLLLQCTQSHR